MGTILAIFRPFEISALDSALDSGLDSALDMALDSTLDLTSDSTLDLTFDSTLDLISKFSPSSSSQIWLNPHPHMAASILYPSIEFNDEGTPGQF